MKWGKHTLIGICSSVMLITSGLSIHALVARLGSIKECVFNFDNRLSPALQEQLRHTIEQQVCAGKKYEAIAAAVTKTFSCVDGIVMHHCAPGTLYCEITSVQPLIHINDSYIVTAQGQLVAPDCFSRAVVHSLHTMQVDQVDGATHMSDTFVTAARALVPELLDLYDVRWIDDKKMILQEKEEPHFSIVCNAHTIPNKEMLTHCQQLKHEVLLAKLSKMQWWSADIRFEHQIIAWRG